jgi:ATP-binding cassette, subfamily B, bacterial
MPAPVRTVSKKADSEKIADTPAKRKRLTIRALLRPHAAALSLGFLAVLGEAIANLLQPWPLKIVLDEVFKNRAGRADLPHFVYGFLGPDKFATIKFACIAVMAIALLDAISTYGEKYLTTSVGQWVTYDLRALWAADFQWLRLARRLRADYAGSARLFYL